jgi:octaprenyl-diphosphate synthase
MSSPAAQRSPALSTPLTPLEALHDALAADMAHTNQMILDRLQSPVEMIPQVGRYLIDAGGKRIRPLLTLGCTAIFGPLDPRAYQLATAVEFIHSATLLHDDVVDGSDTRRGRRTANLVYGNQPAVLVGDFLFARAFELMVETGSLDVLGLLSRAAAVIVEGEVAQLAATGNLAATIDDYLGIVSAKTAALFAAASSAGPALSHASTPAREALYRYGHHLGIAFQIADDVLDYTADTGAFGKQLGNDFLEGKITAPIIFALQFCGATEREFWQRCLVDGQTQDSDFEQARAYLRQHDAFSKAHTLAEHHHTLAQEALADVPDHPIRAILHDLAVYAVRRQK